MEDGFIVCPVCGSHLCYTQHIGSEETWMCMSCGMTSTSMMKEGSETEKAVTGNQPRLYIDLKVVDPKGYVWYPAVVAVPDRGMVYLDGTSTKDAEWVGIPVRSLTKKERRMRQYEGKNYLMDVDKLQRFGRDGFVNALTSLGMV